MDKLEESCLLKLIHPPVILVSVFTETGIYPPLSPILSLASIPPETQSVLIYYLNWEFELFATCPRS
ncbi:hypothetical protein SLEP1_g3125 [Rubroshorea leprosula]|uniref:Uncharacterized protein n=1 Tax=Rubroshorea leprosula TaxID=152421 RepID=A0AAV5HNP9_9ROSI|nr:hypothetical protein SLEP1_g3125 [Rubroshorea leprosula]